MGKHIHLYHRSKVRALARTQPVFAYAKQLFAITLLSAFMILLTGCMPLGDEKVNTELFESKEDMKARAAALSPGMTKQEVFEVLGIAPEYFDQLNTEQVQLYVYGRSEVQGSPQQLEDFKRKILAYEGYSLPYREINSSGSLGFAKMKIHKTGYDLKLVMIFEKGRLLRASVEGSPKVNQKQENFIWDTLLKGGVRAAF